MLLPRLIKTSGPLNMVVLGSGYQEKVTIVILKKGLITKCRKVVLKSNAIVEIYGKVIVMNIQQCRIKK